MVDQQRNKVIDTELTISKLRDLQRTYVGGPIPEWMLINVWGEALSELAGDAADLIEWYQSGKVPDQVNIVSFEWEEYKL
jgi:hypothetical protein